MKITVKLAGEKEIMKKIELLEKKGGAELKIAILQSVIHVEGVAKKNSPYEFGVLRASITHEVKTIKDKHQGKVGTNIEYAPWQEFGTSKMPAQPYLIPALKGSQRMILKFLTDAIKRLKT